MADENKKMEDDGERIEEATQRTDEATGVKDRAPVGNDPVADAERGHSLQTADNRVDEATARTEDALGLTRRAPVENNEERIDEAAGDEVRPRKDVGKDPAPVDTRDPDPEDERARVNEATFRTDREGVLRREYDAIKGEVESVFGHADVENDEPDLSDEEGPGDASRDPALYKDDDPYGSDIFATGKRVMLLSSDEESEQSMVGHTGIVQGWESDDSGKRIRVQFEGGLLSVTPQQVKLADNPA